MPFISNDVFIEIFVFPIARNIAAPQLYTARNGIAAKTIIRYVFAYAFTSGSIFPNNEFKINPFPKYIITVITSDIISTKLRS